MRALTGALVMVCAGLLYGMCSPAARADKWNQKTIVKVNAPVDIAGRVLEPGTYVFKLMDSQSDRNIVQIWTAHERHLVDTILAIPTYRDEPTGKTVFRLDERPSESPEALTAWFYPGENYGHEFPGQTNWAEGKIHGSEAGAMKGGK